MKITKNTDIKVTYSEYYIHGIFKVVEGKMSVEFEVFTNKLDTFLPNLKLVLHDAETDNIIQEISTEKEGYY